MNLHTAALRPENSTKNRYKKIYPCTFWKNNKLDSLFSNSYVWISFNFFYLFILIDDDNRVILDPPQDYINASYIQVKNKLCIFNVLIALYSEIKSVSKKPVKISKDNLYRLNDLFSLIIAFLYLFPISKCD